MDTLFLGLLGIMALTVIVGVALGACACWVLYVQSSQRKEMRRRAKEYAMQQAEFDMLHERISDVLGVLHQISKQLAGPLAHEADSAIGSEQQI